jgi:hypothetical protein
MWESGNIRYRDELIKVIRDNVQICEKKFGGRTLLATEAEPSEWSQLEEHEPQCQQFQLKVF